MKGNHNSHFLIHSNSNINEKSNNQKLPRSFGQRKWVSKFKKNPRKKHSSKNRSAYQNLYEGVPKVELNNLLCLTYPKKFQILVGNSERSLWVKVSPTLNWIFDFVSYNSYESYKLKEEFEEKKVEKREGRYDVVLNTFYRRKSLKIGHSIDSFKLSKKKEGVFKEDRILLSCGILAFDLKNKSVLLKKNRDSIEFLFHYRFPIVKHVNKINNEGIICEEFWDTLYNGVKYWYDSELLNVKFEKFEEIFFGSCELQSNFGAQEKLKDLIESERYLILLRIVDEEIEERVLQKKKLNLSKEFENLSFYDLPKGGFQLKEKKNKFIYLENDIDCAAREFKEETGYKLIDKQLLKNCESIEIQSLEDKRFFYKMFILTKREIVRMKEYEKVEETFEKGKFFPLEYFLLLEKFRSCKINRNFTTEVFRKVKNSMEKMNCEKEKEIKELIGIFENSKKKKKKIEKVEFEGFLSKTFKPFEEEKNDWIM